jgi:hypothetical protein
MSASAAESTDCTAAALGAVERFLRYFTTIDNLTSIQSLWLPVHVVVANVGSHRAVYQKHAWTLH